MKKLIFGLIATVMLGIAGNAQTSLYNSRTVKDTNELDAIKAYAAKFGDFQKDYNFNDIKIVSQGSSPKIESIVINDVNFNLKNITNIALVISYVNGVFGNIMIVKTTTNDNINKFVEYENLDKSTIFSANINTANNSVSVVSRSRGQAVADCLNDVYTGHDWVSVGAWITSAFFPQTVVAFAAACVGANK